MEKQKFQSDLRKWKGQVKYLQTRMQKGNKENNGAPGSPVRSTKKQKRKDTVNNSPTRSARKFQKFNLFETEDQKQLIYDTISPQQDTSAFLDTKDGFHFRETSEDLIGSPR